MAVCVCSISVSTRFCVVVSFTGQGKEPATDEGAQGHCCTVLERTKCKRRTRAQLLQASYKGKQVQLASMYKIMHLGASLQL